MRQREQLWLVWCFVCGIAGAFVCGLGVIRFVVHLIESTFRYI